jgi:hypothetical protein
MNSAASQSSSAGCTGGSPCAEVVEHLAQADAEELLPEPVHEDPRRERIFARHEPLREVEPRELFLRLLLREKGGQRRLHGGTAFVHPVAARQDSHDARVWRRFAHEAARQRLFSIGLFLLRSRDLFAQRRELGCDRAEVLCKLRPLLGSALFRGRFRG